MPVTVKKLPDEPILLVTVDGHLNAPMVRELYTKIGELTTDIPAPIYRITDVRKQEASFAEMMGIIKEATKDMQGTTSDPRIFNIFVGRNKMTQIARDVMQRINPHNHPIMDTVEDALTYIRWRLKNTANEQLTESAPEQSG